MIAALAGAYTFRVNECVRGVNRVDDVPIDTPTKHVIVCRYAATSAFVAGFDEARAQSPFGKTRRSREVCACACKIRAHVS